MALYDRFVDAAMRSASAQEKRRFLLALGDFRDEKLIGRTLTFALTDAVATQDVAFLLMRLFANPAARETHLDIHGSALGPHPKSGCPRTCAVTWSI